MSMASRSVRLGELRRPVFATIAAVRPAGVGPSDSRTAERPDCANETASEDEIWFMFGWPYETTACMTRLIYSGLFDECPEPENRQHLIAYGSGAIPFFSGKIKARLQPDFLRHTRSENQRSRQNAVSNGTRSTISSCCTPIRRWAAKSMPCGAATLLLRDVAFALFATDAPFDAQVGAAA